jgi:predicted ATP-dependent endonuclease of OLD family
MKLERALITNFRRLDDVAIQFEETETIFVGPNNSGKTSATSAFRCFLGKRDFKIYDFPLAKLAQIDSYDPDKFDSDNEETHLPFMRLDLWFSLDPASVEYSRVVSLVSVLDEVATVGIGCTFAIDDATALWRDYNKMYPLGEDDTRKLSLSRFLGLEGHLKKYFSIHYYALSENGGKVERLTVPPAEGKRTLRSLIRADFVDAQRNVQDDEETSRGSKLSAAFAAFYKENLKPAEAGAEVIKIIEAHNETLTAHYSESFAELMQILKGFGVPSASERELKIVSMLGAEEALKGTTDLFYGEAGSTQQLPEAYNGLGFKNLVLMAIQMRDYQMQWANTEEDRPLCHLIFVEEPEVHLHAQVQQTFIVNMWAILRELAEKEGIAPQLVVTTHSSHVLNSVDFEKVRYFRRCRRPDEDPQKFPLLSISEVHNLRDFQLREIGEMERDEKLAPEEALNFLKRYLTLTHCDLMFADAAILVEGTVERLLLPAMIKQVEANLLQSYLTTLEVGGAYAHVFGELMRFLHIPYLVITDIDSVKGPQGGGRKSACCAADAEAVTSNGALKAFFNGVQSIAELNAITADQQTQEDGNRYVTFQKPVEIAYEGENISLHGRTMEEAFIYENLAVFRDGGPLPKIELPENAAEINQYVFELVRRSTFKKTDFALSVLSVDLNEWTTPKYIHEGLSWLSKRLQVATKPAADNNAA